MIINKIFEEDENDIIALDEMAGIEFDNEILFNNVLNNKKS